MSRTRFILLLAFVTIIVASGISLLGVEVVKSTGNDEFCRACHEMQPMVKTYQQDTHGGNNPHGFSAECVDCHLPHTSTVGYLLSKGVQGTNDVITKTFTDTSDINWLENRKKRESYVYDSGCLECHNQLLDKTKADNPKSLEMHKLYKDMSNKNPVLKCVSCHVTVGHAGSLRGELNQTAPEYKFLKERLSDEARHVK
ncbi:NapC/NirT family cytochrome c [Salmonella enterica]|nr:cytochrome C [Salmonella enterica]EDN6746653.1 cytochrome C [Salmonella enterica]EJH8643337.1 NapC/NirT family cytochrome c [Salmonella enterica]ELI0026031.1 NapC/NirT family cytochrome c [Salmonella enterica]ELI0151828.1 NapC/NirT family cytochrome c [Salmonella enterica]